MHVLFRRGRRPPCTRPLHQRTVSSSTTTTASHPPFPHHHEEDQAQEESEPITNRSYWTRRIHSLCSAHSNVDEALRLLDQLRLRGYQPDSLNLSSIIHALCDSSRFHEAHQRLLLSVGSNWVPDERTSNVLVARLLDGRIPHVTLQVFRRLVAAKPGFVPSLTNYNRLVGCFCSVSEPGSAHNVMVEMKNVGHFPNVVSYTTVVDGFGRIGELVSAQQVFVEMVKSGVPPNALTYSALIKGVLRTRRIDDWRRSVGQLWLRMAEEDNPSVNNAAFANIMDALCREGFVSELFGIAEGMPQGKCVTEVFAYGHMIDSLCRTGRHHGASRIVYIMRKRGFVPSLVSYNCIVHNLSKEGEGGCMRAYQLFTEGIVFGYSPTETTYKVLVEGLCREMDVPKAKDVTEFMLRKEGIDKTRIYNMFLSALRLIEIPSEQLNVLVSMLQNQCRPDVVTLNTVIHGFCKISKINEAMKILDDMLRGKFCSPDVITFTTIISGLLDLGRMDEALDLLHSKMCKCGCRPTIVTYNLVLRGLCKLQQVDKAIDVFHEMVAKGVAANSATYTIMIDGLWQMGRVLDAKKFWEDVVWPSKVHDDFVYAAILRGLCNMGKLNEACDFLYELVDCRVSPGVVIYNILIDSACKLGLKKEAYQIVSEMRKNGLTPDAVTWRILDKLHGNVKRGHTSCSANPESELILEEGIVHSKSTHRNEQAIRDTEKEYDRKAEKDDLSMWGLHEDCDPLKSQVKEPLSSLARRLFGQITEVESQAIQLLN